jgi:phospholipid transport system substrate-binding protein
MFSTRCLAALLLFGTVTVAVAKTPTDTVERFHAVLTTSMDEAAKLGCEGRLKKMQPAVNDAFDLQFIAERALRRHWKTLDDAQHASFASALERSVVTTYATEFASPGAARFATTGIETLPNGDAVVHTTLTPQKGSVVSLDYVLREREGQWRIVNVLAEGVSDLALRATQYDGLIKSAGFPALMTRLEEQTTALKGRCP